MADTTADEASDATELTALVAPATTDERALLTSWRFQTGEADAKVIARGTRANFMVFLV